MEKSYHIVRFTGPFGFIKPWTAVRDGETHSQQFLTPSIIEGMRQKLEVSAILRHRLRHHGFSRQQEQTQPRGWKTNRTNLTRERSILIRHVLLQPTLLLAFPSEEDAVRASVQHLCLCRSEDLIYPVGEPVPMEVHNFDDLPGIELIFEDGPDSFPVGFNRYGGSMEMRGRIAVIGDPVSVEAPE